MVRRAIRNLIRKAAAQRQVGRQRHESGESLGKTQSRVQRDSATLGESCNCDPVGPHAAVLFAPDERIENLAARANTLFIGGTTAIEADDVVPGAHGHAAVDRHGPHRRMREHEPQRQRIRNPQLRHDRFEIVAIGAETVQPDDGARRGRAGFDFYGICHSRVLSS